MRKIIALLLVFLCTILFVQSAVTKSKGEQDSNIRRAVEYLTNQFNPEINLTYESEDQGTHWLRTCDYPDYRWGYSQTYWLTSDNLVAMYALQPWNPELSHLINKSLHSYSIPPSGKFEALFGTLVGPERQARNVQVTTTPNTCILARIHNGSLADPRFRFADVLVYEALTQFWLGKIPKAHKLIQEVQTMWNGSCIVDSSIADKHIHKQDQAPSDLDYNTTFKIALLLYAVRVTDYPMSQEEFRALEDHLWSRQLENGGIAVAYAIKRNWIKIATSTPIAR